jgi:hypothetical protein
MNFRIRTALVAAGLAATLAVAPAGAAPTVQLTGGYTLVELAPEFVGALGTLGITATKNLPATLHNRIALFPITGGRLDAANAKGEVPHAGGLRLAKGVTQVTLTDFTIDTTGATPVLTGLVTANGSLAGRLPLFAVALPAGITLPLALPVGPEQLLVEGNRLTLTAEAATALNGAFATTAFAPGFGIGIASVYANY